MIHVCTRVLVRQNAGDIIRPSPTLNVGQCHRIVAANLLGMDGNILTKNVMYLEHNTCNW